MLALLLALAAPVSPEVALRQAAMVDYFDYADCVRDKTIRAAMSSKGEPREIAKSVLPQCGSEWRKFENVFLMGASTSQGDLQALDYFHDYPVGPASSDVVEMRIGSCGSDPGPYQCRVTRSAKRRR